MQLHQGGDPNALRSAPVGVGSRTVSTTQRGGALLGWLKEYRRVATRYENLAVHILAMVTLAIIQRDRRFLDPSTKPRSQVLLRS